MKVFLSFFACRLGLLLTYWAFLSLTNVHVDFYWDAFAANKKGTDRVPVVTVASIDQDAEAGQLTARDAAGAERLFFSRTPRTVRR